MWTFKEHKQLPLVGALILLSAVSALFIYRQHVFIERLQENILFAARPSAERAYSYGLRHFEASAPEEYDVERATYFFNKALEIDASYPMVHYQLARIAFLQSYFHTALDLV